MEGPAAGTDLSQFDRGEAGRKSAHSIARRTFLSRTVILSHALSPSRAAAWACAPWRSLGMRSLVLRLAMAALLFGTFVPSLSTMLIDASGKTWVEVCTASGTQSVAVDAGDAPDESGQGLSGPHCPYCRLQQDLPAIAHAPGVLVLADGSVLSVPPVHASPPPPEDAPWPALRSRAPPHLS